MKPLENRIGIIDANASGVSGDKYLGALVDLGAKPNSLRKVAEVVAENLPGTKDVDVGVRHVERGEVGATLVTIRSKEEVDHRKGGVVRSSLAKCTEKVGLSEWGRKFSLSSIDTLLEAESRVHGHKYEDVVLHELGSADTLVDILGVACLVEELELDGASWRSTPIAVGGGTTRFSGRTYPNPPPAVAEIIRSHKFPMEPGHANQELSTPTGVAITVSLAKYMSDQPPMRLERIGYGAGSKELEEVANVLRLTIGQNVESSHSHDQIVILETNLDDASGEVIGRAVEQLMDSGALDVTIAPVYMKKNRPGHIVSVIAPKDNAEKLVDVLIAETGTLGVRELPVTRHISPRANTMISLRIKGERHASRVKLSQDRRGRTIGAKLEYEDLRRIANQTGLSLREIQNIAKPQLIALHK